MQRLVTMLQQAEEYVGTVVDGKLPADPHMGRKVCIVCVYVCMYFREHPQVFVLFFVLTSILPQQQQQAQTERENVV